MARCALFVALLASAHACTILLVSKGASEDGSTMVTYNSDAPDQYGGVGVLPKGTHPAGTMRESWDWDDGKYRGSFPEANETYNVVSNVNEWGVMIGESTFGGVQALSGFGTDNVVDYGMMIWAALQRSKTAREAIYVMDDLAKKYGYASSGESFDIADPNEVWLLEFIGKGKEKGAVWVASRVPDGYICATGNQARTQKINFNDPENVLYAPDVVTFAQEKGLYPKDGKPEDFSFTAAYSPLNFYSARHGEARVFNMFNQACDNCMMEYLDYAQGYNLTNIMPLFAKVTKKLSVNDTMNIMRTTYDNTWFDARGLNTPSSRPDVGAGPGSSPARWQPGLWTHNNQSYVNERPVATYYTALAFVAQSRSWMPHGMQAISWFAPDDAGTALRVPMYGGSSKVPPAFGYRRGQEPGQALSYAVDSDTFQFSMDSAFWIWNLVANMAYGTRWRDIHPYTMKKLYSIQNRLFEQTKEMDARAVTLHAQDPKAAMDAITDFQVKLGQDVLSEWRNFWMELVVRFRDGMIIAPPKHPLCKPGQKNECTMKQFPDVDFSPAPDNWYARVVEENGAHYKAPHPPPNEMAASHPRAKKRGLA